MLTNGLNYCFYCYYVSQLGIHLESMECLFTLHSPGYSIWNGYGMDGIHKIGYVFHGMGDGFHLHSTPFHGHSTPIPPPIPYGIHGLYSME